MAKEDHKDSASFDQRNNRFSEVLSTVIEETLAATLGHSGAEATFARLEREYDLKKEKVSEDLEKFHTGMIKIVGPGTLLIEEYIVKRLYALLFDERLNALSKRKNIDRSFPGCIQNLKIMYTSRSESL